MINILVWGSQWNLRASNFLSSYLKLELFFGFPYFPNRIWFCLLFRRFPSLSVSLFCLSERNPNRLGPRSLGTQSRKQNLFFYFCFSSPTLPSSVPFPSSLSFLSLSQTLPFPFPFSSHSPRAEASQKVCSPFSLRLVRDTLFYSPVSHSCHKSLQTPPEPPRALTWLSIVKFFDCRWSKLRRWS